MIDDQDDTHRSQRGRSHRRGRDRRGRDRDRRRCHGGRGRLDETSRKGRHRIRRIKETEAATGVARVRPRPDLSRRREDGIAARVDHRSDRRRVGCLRAVGAQIAEGELPGDVGSLGDGRYLVQVEGEHPARRRRSGGLAPCVGSSGGGDEHVHRWRRASFNHH